MKYQMESASFDHAWVEIQNADGTNPTRVLTAAIHVYGGDFVHQPRSQWGPGPEVEQPYDVDQAQQEFAEANRRWAADRTTV